MAKLQAVLGPIGRNDAVCLFASACYDLDRLGRLIAEAFPGPVLACTSAGEWCDGVGMTTGSITAAVLPSPDVRLHTELVRNPEHLSSADAIRIAAKLNRRCQKPGDPNSIGLFLSDGTIPTEPAAAAVFAALDYRRMVGAGAGDDGAFRRSHVYHDGVFHERAAVVGLLESRWPMATFNIRHIVPTQRRLVVTGVDSTGRRVTELNGMSAADAYAFAIDVPRDSLCYRVFSTHPLVARIAGEACVRSIRATNSDGSLDLYCAVSLGMVLRVGECSNLLRNLATRLSSEIAAVPNPQLILAFDCMLRRVELEAIGAVDQAAGTLPPVPMVGFCTYGEYHQGVHLNQTMTGLIIGGAHAQS
ncbi:MAG: FIST N-terminal domain-containing protein [Tepidisphaeraceae bacterium]